MKRSLTVNDDGSWMLLTPNAMVSYPHLGATDSTIVLLTAWSQRLLSDPVFGLKDVAAQTGATELHNVAIISCAPSFAWLGLGGQRTPCFWASQRVEAIAWRGRTRHPPIRAEGKSWLWPADHTSCCVAKARVATSVVWQHGAPFVAIRWAALHALLMKELKAEGVRCVCSFLDTCISSRRSRVPYQRSSFSPCRFGGNGSTIVELNACLAQRRRWRRHPCNPWRRRRACRLVNRI